MTRDETLMPILSELQAFMSSLPEGGKRVDLRYVDEYHRFIEQLTLASGQDLDTYRIPEGELKSEVDEFKNLSPSFSATGLPASWNEPKAEVDRLKSLGSRLISKFSTHDRRSDLIQQHITVSGSANQLVVGVSGGTLSQSAHLEVRAGDEDALLTGLEQIKIDPERLEGLRELLAASTDPDSKRASVRKWMRTFTHDVFTGTITDTLANQVPAAVAMAMGFLS